MFRRIYALLTLILFFACNCRAAELKDPRIVPITAAELKTAIRHTPLTSNKHTRLISRAIVSGLARLSYAEYNTLWVSNQENGSTNLWRGMAAMTTWSWYMGKPKGTTKERFPEELFGIARDSLAKAYKLMPLSATANMEYGFFLWQYDYQGAKGLALLKEAKQLAYTDPRAHVYLALVYSNKTGNYYNLGLAKDELQIALKLDNSYATAHSLLSDVYRYMGQKQLAQQEEKKYLSLLP